MPEIKYIPDAEVDPELDRELRELLFTCFPREALFRERRYLREAPAHRWVLREDGQLAAHTALHDKTLFSPAGAIEFGGVAEVAVHPDFRGRGYVRQMLEAIHDWLAHRQVPFAVLFGNARVYASSGYIPITNPIHYFDRRENRWMTRIIESAMVKRIGKREFPDGLIDLKGPMF